MGVMPSEFRPLPASTSDVPYDGAGTVLVAADGVPATAHVAAAIMEAGLPMTAVAAIADAAALLDRRPGVLFVELSRSPQSPEAVDALDALIDRAAADAAAGRYRLVVSTPAAMIDGIAARLDGGDMQQLADATHADRVSALRAPAASPGVRERGGEGADAMRLRALTDEVGRIAGALARLSGGAAAAPSPAPTDDARADVDGADLAELARIKRVRGVRGRHFDPALFADPAWDMLLDLAAARIAGKPVAVSSLCIAAAVPPTTALRWIKMLTDAGLFARRADPADGRRVFVDLGDEAMAAMRAYLAEVRRAS